MILGLVVGYMLFGFIISFAVIALCWVAGWRKYPKWRARFWWATFALAGILTTGTSIGTQPQEHAGMNIAGIVLFVTALVLKKN